MERPAILLAAVAPATAVLAYGIVKTRGDWRNEALWSALLAGAVSVIAAAAVELVLGLLLHPASLSPLAGAALSALVVAALPEETLKFVVLVFMAERHPDLRRRQDIIVVALGVAAGFAALENFFYLIAPSDWVDVARLRSVTAVPGHAIDGLVMGALLTRARLKPDRPILRLGAALAVPVILHAGYDFPLFVLDANKNADWAAWSWLGVAAVSAILAIALGNRAIAAARLADRQAGRDDGGAPDGRSLVALGAVLLVLVPALGLLGSPSHHGALPLARLALGILPAALGLDLLLTAFRRGRPPARS